MLMRGDLNKIIEKFNGVFDTAFNRIAALEERVKTLEVLEARVAILEAVDAPKKPVGRPAKKKVA